MQRTKTGLTVAILGAVAAALVLGPCGPAFAADTPAKEILKAAGLQAGLCIHLGCGRA